MLCVVSVEISLRLVLVAAHVANVPSHLVRLMHHLHVVRHARPLHILPT